MIAASGAHTASRSSAHHQRGQAMVEFALTAMISLLLIFGILDFGRALFTFHLVANAARLGSRYAMVHGASCAAIGCSQTSVQIQTYVQNQQAGIDGPSLAVNTTWPGTGVCNAAPAPAGCPVNVSVTYPFKFVAFSWGSINMTSVSQMTISQ